MVNYYFEDDTVKKTRYGVVFEATYDTRAQTYFWRREADWSPEEYRMRLDFEELVEAVKERITDVAEQEILLQFLMKEI